MEMGPVPEWLPVKRGSPPTRVSHRVGILLASKVVTKAWLRNRQAARVRLSSHDLNAIARCPARHAECALDRVHDCGKHFRTRVQPAEVIVKSLAYEFGVTKDTPSHGHRRRRHCPRRTGGGSRRWRSAPVPRLLP